MVKLKSFKSVFYLLFLLPIMANVYSAGRVSVISKDRVTVHSTVGQHQLFIAGKSAINPEGKRFVENQARQESINGFGVFQQNELEIELPGEVDYAYLTCIGLADKSPNQTDGKPWDINQVAFGDVNEGARVFMPDRNYKNSTTNIMWLHFNVTKALQGKSGNITVQVANFAVQEKGDIPSFGAWALTCVCKAHGGLNCVVLLDGYHVGNNTQDGFYFNLHEDVVGNLGDGEPKFIAFAANKDPMDSKEYGNSVLIHGKKLETAGGRYKDNFFNRTSELTNEKGIDCAWVPLKFDKEESWKIAFTKPEIHMTINLASGDDYFIPGIYGFEIPVTEMVK